VWSSSTLAHLCMQTDTHMHYRCCYGYMVQAGAMNTPGVKGPDMAHGVASANTNMQVQHINHQGRTLTS
jgi:hypothetical protein